MVMQLGGWLVLCVGLASACSGTSKAVHEQALARDKQAAAPPPARTLHPASGSEDCIEMYGTCTPPPDQLCTSEAFVLGCGESGELPSSGERVTCVCP